MKSEWLILGDVHCGAGGDHKATRDMMSRYFNEQLFPLIESRGIKTIIGMGDFFDRRKFINFETLKFAKEVFFDRVKAMGLEMYMIIGNHDTYYKNTNAVNSVKLVVTPTEYPNIHVYSNPETVTIDGIRVLMLPWINAENYGESVRLLKETDAAYVVGHLELGGFEYMRGIVSDHGQIDEDLLGRFSAVWTGHYHHKSSRGNIHYVGTPYQLTWNDYGDVKGVHVFNGSEQLEFIPNHEEIFIRVVYDDTDKKATEKRIKELPSYAGKKLKVVVRAKNHPIMFERYLDAITQSGPLDVNVIDETNAVRVAENAVDELPKDTLEIIGQFIYNDLETDLDKGRLLYKIQRIYVAAKEIAEDE